jgi:hypothetical protein
MSKTTEEWAWEFHKNCDAPLHARLASFTSAQAMTLALTWLRIFFV